MPDFSNRTRTGISILTSAADKFDNVGPSFSVRSSLLDSFGKWPATEKYGVTQKSDLFPVFCMVFVQYLRDKILQQNAALLKRSQ